MWQFLWASTVGQHLQQWRKVDFAAPRNMVVCSTRFQHINIHKAAWLSPDQNTHNQIDHVVLTPLSSCSQSQDTHTKAVRQTAHRMLDIGNQAENNSCQLVQFGVGRRLRRKSLSRRTKFTSISLIISVLLYRAETQTMTTRNEKKLGSFE